MQRFKLLLFTVLFAFLSVPQLSMAQEKDPMTRPRKSGVELCDVYMNKAFDFYNDVLSLTYELQYTRVEIKEGLGQNAPIKMRILNGGGEPMGKDAAMDRLTMLQKKLNTLSGRVDTVTTAWKEAEEDRSRSVMKKVRTKKEYEDSNKAREYAISELQKWTEQINKYIATLNSSRTTVVN